MYSWLVNTLRIYNHQFLTNGSQFAPKIHNYNTAASSTGKLFKSSFWTNLYGKNSITVSGVNARNKIQTVFGEVILKNLTTTQIKTLITKKCI